LQQIGTQHTSMLKPSMSLEHTSSNVTLETMMAANMHVGHCASLWNPMNLPHIFGERQGVHIINLEHTLAALRRAAQFTRSVAYHGGIILFAGARSQHQQLAVDAAHFSDQYFVTGKWVPGTLTNPQSLLAKHQLSRYLRKLADEKAKLKEDAGNVRTFAPDLVVALNPLESRTMLAETRLRHVPTVGIVDTNCDPRCVSYAIPCNDDSLRAVSVVAGVLARAARDGMDLRRQQ
ncbi:ribosomal protein S2, partial [Linderina pennispora]